MTTKERLAVHDDIDRQNAEHMKRYKLTLLYTALVRDGSLEEARLVLRLLRRGCLCMGLGDVDWNVQTALEDIGHPVHFSRNGNKAYAYCERRVSA